MKVLQFFRTYMPTTCGGIEEAIRQICLATARQGVEQRLLTLAPVDRVQTLERPEARVIQATEAGELLPRAFAEASHFECKFCSYAQRCWGGV